MLEYMCILKMKVSMNNITAIAYKAARYRNKVEWRKGTIDFVAYPINLMYNILALVKFSRISPESMVFA